MNLKKMLLASAALLATCGLAPAQLLVDFNSTNQDGAANNHPGFEAYDAAHETPADFVTKNYNAFGTSVSLTPAWPNTTAASVQQMIDRTATYDVTWTDVTNILVAGVTDWIGVDTRTGNGGNGNWDGTTGTPTEMTLTLGGLPAAPYEWTSFHHDTENVHAYFATWLSTDGGANFTQLADGYMSDGTAGGDPDSTADGSPGLVADVAGMGAAGSIYEFSFAANGTDDVVLKFAPYSGQLGDAVHNQLFGINGFQLAQVPEPATASLLVMASLCVFGLRRRR